MNLQYEILFSVFFKHTFFAGNIIKVLNVHPDKKSVLNILRRGLLFKPFEGGFHVLYETNFGGKKRQREEVLKEEFFLDLIINNNDPNFFSYTSDFSVGISQYLFFFTNFHDSRSLQKADYVSKEDLYDLSCCTANNCPVNDCCAKNYCGKTSGCPINKYPEIYFKKPFGLINIIVNNSLEKMYHVTFSAISTFWRYIIVSDYLKELASPAIIHKKVQFNKQENIGLRDYKAFVSEQEIELKEQPDKGFQLVENYDREKGRYKVVISMLPNPAINNISFIGSEAGNKDKKIFSEIFI